MSKTPALGLATLLRDIMPTTDGPNDPPGGFEDGTQGKHLALPDFLVYFPLRTPPTELAPDGADADHVPEGQALAGPEEPASRGLRLWTGGMVHFSRSWRKSFALDRSAVERACREEGQMEISGSWPCTSLRRTYGPVDENGAVVDPPLVEVRRLAFVQGRVAERILRADSSQSPTTSARQVAAGGFAHAFTTTPAQLFQFSALTFNAHYIHLDPRNGLVHGPLQLALMLRAAEQHLERDAPRLVKEVRYDCLKPLRVGQKAWVCLEPEAGPEGDWRVWIERDDGVVVTKGVLEVW